MRTMKMSGYNFYVAVATTLFVTVDARVWLEVPTVANCRGDTVLTCHYCDTPFTKRTWSRKIGQVWETIMENGTQTRYMQRPIIKEEINGWISLIIRGADNMAAGFYRCGVGPFHSEGAELRVECKPEKAKVTLTSDKFIEIQMNTVFPVPKLNFTMMAGARKGSTISFEYPKCRGHSWLQDCVWTSTTTIPDGHHSYNLVATTVTETLFAGNIN